MERSNKEGEKRRRGRGKGNEGIRVEDGGRELCPPLFIPLFVSPRRKWWEVWPPATWEVPHRELQFYYARMPEDRLAKGMGGDEMRGDGRRWRR